MPNELTLEGESKIKKFNEEMDGIANDLISTLPEQMEEINNSEEYKQYSEAADKMNAEAQVLFDLYKEFISTEKGASVPDFVVYPHGLPDTYAQEMKANNAPEEVVKRFEEFNKKFTGPWLAADLAWSDKITRSSNNLFHQFRTSLEEKLEKSSLSESDRKEIYQENNKKFQDAVCEIRKEKLPLSKSVGMIYS